MGDITLKLDEKELNLLIKLAYTGLYVVNEEADKKRLDSEVLLDHLLELAKTNKTMTGIEFDKELNGFFLEDSAEEQLLEEYSSFVEDSFWEELVARLTQRDLVEKEGLAAIEKMDEEKLEKKAAEVEEMYEQEFDTNGIRNLKLTAKK